MATAPLHRMPELRSSDYENDIDHLRELDQLARQIDKDMSDERMDAKAVARFQTGLLQFMENAFGPNSMPPRQFPKIPFHLVDDHFPSGALYDIIMKCLQLKEAKNMKHLEWTNPQQRMLLVSILSTVRATLIKNGYPISPTVLLDEGLSPDDVSELTGMIESMKGRVVKDRNAVGLTHIVYPFPDGSDPDDGEEYMRSQRRRGEKVLVHRWYTPDSHNEWLEAAVAPETIENDQEHVLPGPAKVTLRWVRDSKRYNEWMNIVDYETTEGEQEHERYREELRQKGLTPAQLVARKRKASRQAAGTGKVLAEAALLEVDPNFRETVSDGVVRRHMIQAPKRVREGTANSENLSYGQQAKLFEGSDVPRAMARMRPAPVNAGVVVNTANEPRHTLPLYAHWFRQGAIADEERNSNVEFFNGTSPTKTPELYKRWRNCMIALYRENPKQKLTLSACRQKIQGDVCAIQRVWRFLESWGLINFEAPAQRALDEPLEVVTVDDSGTRGKHVRVLGPAQSSLPAPSEQRLLHRPAATVLGAVDAAIGVHDRPLGKPAGAEAFAAVNESSRRLLAEATGEPMDTYCSATGVKCTDLRYHCTKHADVHLGARAFAEGRFPPGTAAKDFVKVDRAAAAPMDGGWSDQETLLLLEGLHTFGDKWDKIAELVGTKSRLDCVLRFASLNIEEEFTAHLAARPSPSGSSASEQTTSGRAVPAPLFSNAANPHAAQLSFISEVLGTKTSAGAVAAALEELTCSGSVVHNEAARPIVHAAAPGGSAPMDIDEAGASSAPGGGADAWRYVPVEDVEDWSAAVPPEKQAGMCQAALLGAAVKAKLLADAEGRAVEELAAKVLALFQAKMRQKGTFVEGQAGVTAEQCKVAEQRRAKILADHEGRHAAAAELAKQEAAVAARRREVQALNASLPAHARLDVKNTATLAARAGPEPPVLQGGADPSGAAGTGTRSDHQHRAFATPAAAPTAAASAQQGGAGTAGAGASRPNAAGPAVGTAGTPCGATLAADAVRVDPSAPAAGAAPAASALGAPSQG